MIGTKVYVLVLDGFADWEPALRARLERAVSEGELPGRLSGYDDLLRHGSAGYVHSRRVTKRHGKLSLTPVARWQRGTDWSHNMRVTASPP